MIDIKMILDYLIVPLIAILVYHNKKITLLEKENVELKFQYKKISPLEETLKKVSEDVHTLVTLSKIYFKKDIK